MQLSVTTIIIFITVLISIWGFSNRKIIDDLIFYPPAVSKQNQWYRFFSHGLIHADYMHLLFNMLSLFSFGPFVEEKFIEIFGNAGMWYYLVMYVSALLVAILPTYQKHKNDYGYRSLGASGAVSAVIFAGLMIVPHLGVGFFFIPVYIPGFLFAPLYLLISAYLERSGHGSVNHSAHIWGAIYGLAFVIVAGRLVGYNAIQAFIEGVQLYMRSKGWLS